MIETIFNVILFETLVNTNEIFANQEKYKAFYLSMLKNAHVCKIIFLRIIQRKLNKIKGRK